MQIYEYMKYDKINKYMIYDKQNVPNPELLVFLSYLNNLLIYGTRLYGNKSILFLR